LKRAIAKLPEEQQSIILLVGLKGMAYAQAAVVVNAPVGTVRSRVAGGRETLRVMTELFPPRHSRRPCEAAPDPQRRPAPHSSSNRAPFIYRFAIPLLALNGGAGHSRGMSAVEGRPAVVSSWQVFSGRTRGRIPQFNERRLFRACRWCPIHNTAWLRQRRAEVTWP
jgi:hypothetical protein